MLWIAFISIVFCLPELNPVRSQTLNYAPVAVGIVVTSALGFWAISARRWFAGPIKQIAGAPALSTPFSLVSADKRSSGTEIKMGISVTESVVISEEPESLKKSTSSHKQAHLEPLIVEGREGRHTTSWHGVGLRRSCSRTRPAIWSPSYNIY